MWLKFSEWRRIAKAYVRGENAFSLDNCLPCDVFVDARQNMAAIKLTLSHLRGLERLGNPFVVERVMERSFKAALTTGGASGNDTAA